VLDNMVYAAEFTAFLQLLTSREIGEVK
jgi:hypothetical protein